MANPAGTYSTPHDLGYAYVPYGSAQYLSVNPYGMRAAQAEAFRRQNLNVQAHVYQFGNNNQNVQSDIGQSQRRQNLNAQSNVAQMGRRR